MALSSVARTDRPMTDEAPLGSNRPHVEVSLGKALNSVEFFPICLAAPCVSGFVEHHGGMKVLKSATQVQSIYNVYTNLPQLSLSHNEAC